MPGVKDTVAYTGNGGQVMKEDGGYFVQYRAVYHDKAKRFGSLRGAVAWLVKQQAKTQEIVARGK